MPSTEEVGLDARRAALRETYEAIQEEVRRIEDKGDPLDYASLSLFLRNLFAAPRDIFEPVPRNVALNANEREAWLKRQVKLWFDDAEKRVEDDARVDSVKQRELLATLRDNIRTGDGNGDLGEFLKRNLGRITDVPTGVAARFPFSVAFGNVLRTGRWERVSPTSPGESDSTYLASLVKGMADNSREREASPHWKTVIEPILKRIDYLADNALAGARPPQPGDDELGKILESINACHA